MKKMRAENRERRGGSNLIGGSCFRWWSLGVFAMVFSFSLKLKLQVQEMDLVTANGWRRYVLKWQFLWMYEMEMVEQQRSLEM
ncbi:hypothetical protein C5167_045756 [Papaver somniferum]|uniref:Uncharacterized protein n=1 Tax=Papaver somniferum TaxID=3469 RepID=A0A4Y7LCL7_PAPSO|nr:hypothetical protein C5167_045756 [Papaver somniferum]